MERQDEVIGADVHLVLAERTDAGVLVAVVGDVHHQVRRLAAHERIGRLESAARGRFTQQPVHDRRVRGVDAALQTLQPVALLNDFRHVAIGFRRLRPGEFRHRRHVLDRTEIRPDDAAEFARRIRCEPDLVLEVILRRFVHHVGAGAGDVELPTVINAAQTALFVATKVAARRGGAGRVRRSSQCGPLCHGKRRGPRRAGGHGSGGPSGSATSRDRAAGIQYRRSALPIGVPWPTRVTSSFSSRDSMAILLVRPVGAVRGKPIAAGMARQRRRDRPYRSAFQNSATKPRASTCSGCRRMRGSPPWQPHA